MIKGLAILNLWLLMYHGYVYIKFSGTVPHETVVGITTAALLVGFIFQGKEPPSE